MHVFGEIGVLADDGEKVQCHLCGKWFLILNRHVTGTHKIGLDDYSDRYATKT